MDWKRPLIGLIGFSLALLITRGIRIQVASAENHHDSGPRAFNLMVLVGMGNNINIHHAKVATTDDTAGS